MGVDLRNHLFAPGLSPGWFRNKATLSLPNKRIAWAAVERGGNNLNSSKDFRTDNGSSQGQNLALTGLYVPFLLGSGT